MSKPSSSDGRPISIGLIVEGHGEVLALPELVRRVCAHLQVSAVVASRGFRVPRSNLTSTSSSDFENALAALAGNDAILVVLDADDDCPVTLARDLQNRAGIRFSETPQVEVIIANREFEAWIIAGFIDFPSKHVNHQLLPSDPERQRDAKGALRVSLTQRKYTATVDQVRLSAQFSLDSARANSRSFRRLIDAIQSLSPRGSEKGAE